MMHEQLLAADNLVMGTTNILVIAVPEGWRIINGHAAPEVDGWSEYRERRWMSQGQAPYRLVEPHPDQPGMVRSEVELVISAKPTHASDHSTRHTFGTVKRGFLPRRDVPALRLQVDCPQTGRRIQLDLQSSIRNGMPTAAREDLERLLKVLTEGLRCH